MKRRVIGVALPLVIGAGLLTAFRDIGSRSLSLFKQASGFYSSTIERLPANVRILKLWLPFPMRSFEVSPPDPVPFCESSYPVETGYSSTHPVAGPEAKPLLWLSIYNDPGYLLERKLGSEKPSRLAAEMLFGPDSSQATAEKFGQAGKVLSMKSKATSLWQDETTDVYRSHCPRAGNPQAHKTRQQTS